MSSDWSIILKLSSDWSIILILSSDWSIILMLSSDWSGTRAGSSVTPGERGPVSSQSALEVPREHSGWRCSESPRRTGPYFVNMNPLSLGIIE